MARNIDFMLSTYFYSKLHEIPFIPRVLVISWALTFASFLALMSDMAMAQKLIIETPSQGPSSRVFYGRISTNDFHIFEKKIDLESENSKMTTNERDDMKLDSSGSNLDPAPTADHSKSTLASMQIRSEELSLCTKSPRFTGFIALISTLKGRVNRAHLAIGDEADSCAEKVDQAIRRTIGEIQFTRGHSSERGIKIELALQSAAVTAAPPTKVNPDLPHTEITFAQIIRDAKLTIGDKPVTFNDAGLFVLEVRDSKEATIELKVPGKKKITLSAFPVTITDTPRSIISSTMYSAVLASFSQKRLQIYVSQTPFLAQKTTIDGGGGGGLGYGREVPGERRGERIVTMIGIEKRQVLGNFGLRSSLLYTNANKTVVPHTFTARMNGFHDFSFGDDSFAIRLALGAELFYSKIKESPKNIIDATDTKTALIPSQVLAPLFSVSMHKAFAKKFLLTSTINLTPLFISSVGLYTAISPTVDLGFKISDNIFAMLSAGSEIHRFPSELGETKLQMDFLTISLKRGIN